MTLMAIEFYDSFWFGLVVLLRLASLASQSLRPEASLASQSLRLELRSPHNPRGLKLRLPPSRRALRGETGCGAQQEIYGEHGRDVYSHQHEEVGMEREDLRYPSAGKPAEKERPESQLHSHA